MLPATEMLTCGAKVQFGGAAGQQRRPQFAWLAFEEPDTSITGAHFDVARGIGENIHFAAFRIEDGATSAWTRQQDLPVGEVPKKTKIGELGTVFVIGELVDAASGVFIDPRMVDGRDAGRGECFAS